LQLASLLRRVALVTKTSLVSLLLPLLLPLGGALIMFGAVRLTAVLLPADLGNKTTLAALVATGMLVYLGYAAVVMRWIFSELAGLLR
jgi:hypothetical protein